MEKDIVEGQIGAVGAYDLEFKEGELRFIVKVGHSGVSAEMKVALNSDGVIDAIKAAIPGQIDDAILDVAKAALKMKV
jgi:hypothetical protein